MNLRGVFVLFRILLTLLIQVGSVSGSAWIRNFCLDPDSELGKFKAGPGSGINSFGSTTLVIIVLKIYTGTVSKKKIFSKIMFNFFFQN